VVLALLCGLHFECFFPFRSVPRLAQAVLPTSLFRPSLQTPSILSFEGTLSVRFEPFEAGARWQSLKSALLHAFDSQPFVVTYVACARCNCFFFSVFRGSVSSGAKGSSQCSAH
jgi:hypothetical protein